MADYHIDQFAYCPLGVKETEPDTDLRRYIKKQAELGRYYGLSSVQKDVKNRGFQMIKQTPDMDKLLASIT